MYCIVLYCIVLYCIVHALELKLPVAVRTVFMYKNILLWVFQDGKRARFSMHIILIHCMAIFETDERESPQEAKAARENSSLGFIEAVHQ